MASYSIPDGHIGVYEKTLVASTVDTVTFSMGAPGTAGYDKNRPKYVEVFNDGADDVYFTIGSPASAPTVAGSHCYYLPGGSPNSYKVPLPATPPRTTPVALEVKLISAGTPVYSVARGVDGES